MGHLLYWVQGSSLPYRSSWSPPRQVSPTRSSLDRRRRISWCPWSSTDFSLAYSRGRTCSSVQGWTSKKRVMGDWQDEEGSMVQVTSHRSELGMDRYTSCVAQSQCSFDIHQFMTPQTAFISSLFAEQRFVRTQKRHCQN